jgi:exodeoxyribonuclease III
MFLVSWNVAAWTTTTAAIRGSFGSLQTFFDTLGADILCLQETKVSKKKLDTDEVTCGAADRPGFPIAGYESFWCYCTERGMNGVCTFVRSGLTFRADARPLNVDALDNEGRCIATYHSHFVLFNVYVPNSRQGERQAFKESFLKALTCSMKRARNETNLPVILVGDMNLTYRTEDCHFSNRKLSLWSLEAALRSAAAAGASPPQVTAPMGGSSHDTPGVEEHQHRFSKRQPLTEYELECLRKVVTFLQEHIMQKLNLATFGPPPVTFKEAAERVHLLRGELQAAARDASAVITSSARAVTGDGDTKLDSLDGAPPTDDGKWRSAAHRDYVWVDTLVRGSPNSLTERNEILYVASECVGLPCHAPGDVAFAQSLLLDAAAPMVDSFVLASIGRRRHDAQLQGHQLTAAGCHRPEIRISSSDTSAVSSFVQPYTCWDQYRNKRYENEGNRIDYIFVDASLAPLVAVDSAMAALTLPTCSAKGGDADDNTPRDAGRSAPAAAADGEGNPTESSRENIVCGFSGLTRRLGIARATSQGRYVAAPSSGGGIEKLRDVDKMLLFDNGRHQRTGLWITPPQFSDHIGVTLLLRRSAMSSASLLQPRPAGTAVVDPGAVLFRRKSANLKDMFARVLTRTPGARATPPPVPGSQQRGKRPRAAEEEDEGAAADGTTPLPPASSSLHSSALATSPATETTAAMEVIYVD